MATQDKTGATKKCRFCQTEIDANATICPSCRKEQKKKLPIWLIVLVVIIALCSLSGLAGSGNKGSNTNTPTGSGTPTKDAQGLKDGDFTKPYKKGAVVNLGDVSWQIVEAKNLGSKLKSTYGGDACVSESGTYIYLKVKVTNNSKDMVTASGLNIYDSEKREMTGASNVMGCIKDQLFILENVNPGLSMTLIDVFEAPKTSKGFVFKATDLKFLNVNEAYLDLGL